MGTVLKLETASQKKMVFTHGIIPRLEHSEKKNHPTVEYRPKIIYLLVRSFIYYTSTIYIYLENVPPFAISKVYRMFGSRRPG